MKKLLAFILVLSILTLAGCSKTGDMLSDTESDLSSQIEINTSEIIYSTEEVVSTEVSSNETSVETNTNINSPSSEITTSSQTEDNTPTPSVSTDETESQNETSSTSTPTPTQPTTYFEKHNLKLSPLTTNVCFNTEKGHVCPDDKKLQIDFDVDSTCYFDSFNADIFGNSFDVSTYKCVRFSINSSHKRNCDNEKYGLSKAIAFDKNTGLIITGTWQKITSSNQTFYTMSLEGASIAGYENIVLCPVNYNNIAFAIFKDTKNKLDTIKYDNQYTLDEIIDFENDEYYLFAADN